MQVKSALADQMGTALRAVRSVAGLRFGSLILGSSQVVRVVNYHGTPVDHAESLREQFRFFDACYRHVGMEEFRRFLDGSWEPNADRPGLVVTFDDGLRSNYEVAASILEDFGWTGWFFVPVGLVEQARSLSADEARLKLNSHSIRVDVSAGEEPPFMMGWDELEDLDERGHVVGAHTMSHSRLGEDVSPERLEEEVVAPRRILEHRLGRTPEAFAWVGGETSSYSREADRMIRSAGYEYCFGTNCRLVRPGDDRMRIDRTNIEAGWPVDRVVFYLSRLIDAYYWPKRLAVRYRLK